MAGECVLVPDKDFDVERSIFSALPEHMKAAILAKRVKPLWSDAAIGCADRAFADVAPVAEERKLLLKFMATECNFKLEHADGHFMDHLIFCRDYCAAHYKAASPTPLLIHSILGTACVRTRGANACGRASAM